MEITDGEKFQEARDEWAKIMVAIREFCKNLGKASADMTGHIKTLEHVRKSEAENAVKNKQKDDLMQVRLEARLAAEAIRNKGQATAAASETLYTVSFDKLKIPAF
eukprot:12105218-Heterocapsa_arctica.AAC.1